ncbi:pantetheine-phosphate adenylyltransferase [Ferrimicrobium acidiphilum]|jgi:pantetheine-phosphate adenylyltransferase|uniref:Phosphopantetheine adenylyltransferase n=1 Tax=Ferrimicrobium acidiphilum DSM 19497 TaxID=1121877 RepID=A0A0D8FVQ4_9ACTN|nr:pantetheine-phosphate adenylyltransferase [Ferrimicrobium acidiphilum]KJE77368.1 phosphopantetheine adenylyltransferase [Ferrimicrobium acidiphilum DSM 19497]MCL5973108.1 pantetheine-phosphate adenylyltransferase [Actinomycetota bacterium]
MRRALFPGSFDPFHNGHLEVVERASKLFDEVVVAAMRNPQKAGPLFSLEERMDLVRLAVDGMQNVSVVALASLVVDLAREVEANVIVRGLRAVSDFEIELQMAQMNRELSGIDTLFVPTSSEYSYLSSKLIREVAAYGGNVSSLVPKAVDVALRERGRPS